MSDIMSKRHGDWLITTNGSEPGQRKGMGDVYDCLNKKKRSKNDVSVIGSESVSNYWRFSISAIFSSVFVLIIGLGVYLGYTIVGDNYMLYISLFLSLLYFVLKFSISYYLMKDAKIVSQYIREIDSPALTRVSGMWIPKAFNWGVLIFLAPPVTEIGVMTVYLSKRKKTIGEPDLS